MWQTLDTKDTNPKKENGTSQPASNSNPLSSQLRSTGEQATIGRSLIIKGEVTGSEPLYIDGRVEGTIILTDNRLTIGRNGSVSANVNAKEVVVMGKLHGNVQVTDRVDIRAEGSLTGDVVAHRLSIEDGAFFKGSVDLKKSEQKMNADAAKNVKPEAAHNASLAMTAAAGKAN
ncbi:MAG: cell shape determination protein CcmA [Acidobacteria bacterium]|nr:MAG: cell shape determination protein CcmA [Acidobacteriota bacterium]PYY09534.1 MAG: cell shape determination protein CcmA [Acidobacteriota bacterium]